MFLNDSYSFPRTLPTTIFCVDLFIVTSRVGLNMKTLKKAIMDYISMTTNVYNTKFSVETCLEHGFCHRIHVFPVIIAVCTLLSLLLLITRVKLYVFDNRRLTPFSWGNSD